MARVIRNDGKDTVNAEQEREKALAREAKVSSRVEKEVENAEARKAKADLKVTKLMEKRANVKKGRYELLNKRTERLNRLETLTKGLTGLTESGTKPKDMHNMRRLRFRARIEQQEIEKIDKRIANLKR